MSSTKTITIPLEEYHHQKSQIIKLQHELAWFKRQVFGPKSEKYIPNENQLSLDLGVDAHDVEQSTETITYSRIQQCIEELPSSPIRKACEYAIGQWEGFTSYLSDGRVELSNNLVENAIRPVVIGRKNYMFKGSEKSAQRGAIIYSLIATAKMHGIDPYQYMKTLLDKLPAMKAHETTALLPYNLCQ